MGVDMDLRLFDVLVAFSGLCLLRLPGTPVKALQLIRKNDTYYTISFRQCHFKGITLDA